jgi:hypothetical protein
MSKWYQTATALMLLGFAACGANDEQADESERQEIRVIYADEKRGLAVEYRDGDISFVLEGTADGKATHSRIVAPDGTTLMQLTMPLDIGPYGGAAMMRHIVGVAAEYKDFADADVYHAAAERIVANLANLNHSNQHYIDFYLGLILQHGLLLRAVVSASSESPPCPEYLAAPTAYPYHTLGDHERQLQEMAKSGGKMPQEMLCAWYNPCCLHDYACIACGAGTQYSLLCGWNCTVGVACMGRCGGGCGSRRQ